MNDYKYRLSMTFTFVFGMLFGIFLWVIISPFLPQILNTEQKTDNSVLDIRENNNNGITVVFDDDLSNSEFKRTDLVYNSVQYGFVYGNAKYGYFLLPYSFEQINSTTFIDNKNDIEVSFDIADLQGKDFKDAIASLKDIYISKGYIITNTSISDDFAELSANFNDEKIIIVLQKDKLKDYIHLCEYKALSIDSFSYFSYSVDYPQKAIDGLNNLFAFIDECEEKGEIYAWGVSDTLFVDCYKDNKQLR